MVIFKKIQDLQDFLSAKRKENMTIGFVPTMGALHEGHQSLVEKSAEHKDLVVCSIFINPTQFNDKSDFEKYPVTTDADILLLTQAGCNVLFLPDVQEMYPDGTDKGNNYDFGYLDTVLEGAHRPGHFKGVGQVVARLLQIVQPQRLYMGQKDYQQCMVVRSLLSQMGVAADTELVICPTLREPDGLAMSSRNTRLTEPQRALASVIYQCLVSIQGKAAEGNFAIVQKECLDILADKGFKPEYVALADARDLTLMNNYDRNRPMVALIAAWLGGVRLIDNLLVNG
jgi:pantoate--beta-alanine ligase